MTSTARLYRAGVWVGAALLMITVEGASTARAAEALRTATDRTALALPVAQTLPLSKARRARHVRLRAMRLASLHRPTCGWSARPCERPFALLLGIGF
jgi:hypothetical protein